MRTAVKVMAAAAVSAGVGIAVIAGNAGAGSKPVGAGSRPIGENNTALAEQLRCPAGDLMMTRINEVNKQDVVGAATPEDAVGRLLQSGYKKLDKSQFKKTSSDEEHAVLEYAKADEKRFITSVRKFDEGRALTAFVACNSTLVEAQ